MLNINEYDNTGDKICHENAICTNTNGSFTCHWQSEYAGNGTVCNGRCQLYSYNIFNFTYSLVHNQANYTIALIK